jgi:hypothetical protein
MRYSYNHASTLCMIYFSVKGVYIMTTGCNFTFHTIPTKNNSYLHMQH